MFKFIFLCLSVVFFACSCYGKLLAEEAGLVFPANNKVEYLAEVTAPSEADGEYGDGFSGDENKDGDGDTGDYAGDVDGDEEGEDSEHGELDKPQTDSDDLKEEGRNCFLPLYNLS